MKKVITIALLFAFTTSINAQWFKRVRGNGNMITKTRTVGEYDKIAAGGSFDVKLVSGTEGKITIYIDENLLAYLVTEVENDKLKLKWKKGSNISTRNKILITVPFKDISGVTLSGSGDVFSEDNIKATDFKAILSGSGNMKLAVTTSYLSSRISGSGNIRLSGAADRLEYAISGSGNINGYELVSNDADVRISGSGGIKTNVTENLKARIAGSGNIYYKGNPKRQDTKVSGSGNVSSR
ncbi:MAG: DUF2807 domain-containing protein [Flavobacteriaceae bacterium]|nr:DUF2807 domain-containing protein [Flavobacteriaceae bacterium]